MLPRQASRAIVQRARRDTHALASLLDDCLAETRFHEKALSGRDDLALRVPRLATELSLESLVFRLDCRVG